MHAPVEKHTTVAIADDHYAMVAGLEYIVSEMPGYRVVFTANDGREFIRKLEEAGSVDIAIVDLKMPVMDGFALMEWLNQHRPEVRAVAYSFSREQQWVARARQAGARAYMLKDSKAADLQGTLDAVRAYGQHWPHALLAEFVQEETSSHADTEQRIDVHIPPREREFLGLVCAVGELTYDQIADIMKVTRYSVDGYFRYFSQNFNLHSRSGLVGWALRKGLASIAGLNGLQGLA